MHDVMRLEQSGADREGLCNEVDGAHRHVLSADKDNRPLIWYTDTLANKASIFLVLFAFSAALPSCFLHILMNFHPGGVRQDICDHHVLTPSSDHRASRCE
ncbi:hypothetical protein AVEN_245954-1 [Araneus ventricosus]|uniref:Uncharacterized protein n=1 Tax=Araneus ventricosus TaxID=182803 RepID=A0A4Y2P2P0_ARAVE|nr:hypothetical protein AVEN_245954-1 [Araneus ventricosus]